MWKDIFYGVPQESIFGPLLFSIHLCDLYYFLEDLDIASYVDNTSIYAVNKKRVSHQCTRNIFITALWLDGLITTYESKLTKIISQWTVQKQLLRWLMVCPLIPQSKLKFDDHVNYLCKKAILKLNALIRIAPNVSKKRIIMKSFIESLFGYCPLIWMFHSRLEDSIIIH